MSELIIFDREILSKAAEALSEKASLLKLRKSLLEEAEEALLRAPYSVTFKEKLAPSGDPKDFTALSRYWWPNPETEDGLPYIRKDGVTNPEIDDYDRTPLGAFCDDFFNLASAYFLQKDLRYGNKAVELLETWFIDEVRGMNPNLTYAGFIPGVVDGRGNGIISTLKFTRILDWITLLYEDQVLREKSYSSLKLWFKSYRNWLIESDHGREESTATNNHGTWYDNQVISYSIFCGDLDYAKEYVQRVSYDRLASQIAKDGSMPEELERTKSLSYSEYNLHAWIEIATMAQRLGEDLWSYMGAGQHVLLESALEYLLPYFSQKETWTYEQIEEFPVVKTLAHLWCAQRVYANRSIAMAIRDIEQIGLPSGRTCLWYAGEFLI